ncbi:hypothetical protein L7F22_023781 [Adiantum nelumboides]|nr:hypothetical protein [Adiantum nelumboides]
MAGPIRRGMHAVARSATSPESQRLLQFKLESIMSVVGGEMVVKDMLFIRNGFDYWRHAAIPSSSIVKELVSTWANVESLNSTITPFKFYADKTEGKTIEEFLQRMVADAEQKVIKEGYNFLGRQLSVQLTDKQEFMEKEASSVSTLVFTKGFGEQESRVEKLENFESNQESNNSTDAEMVGEQEIMAKEGVSSAEEGSYERLDLCDSMPEEKESNCKQERSVVELADKQDPAKVENSGFNLEQSEVEETVGKDAMHMHGIEAQKEEGKNWFATIGSEESHSVADGQKTSEEWSLGTGYRLKKRENSNVKARKQASNKQGIMATSIGLMTSGQHQGMKAQVEEAKIQHTGEKEKLGDTRRIENKKNAELQNAEEAEQNYGVVKDPYQEQTDNIVRKTTRMGRKIVYTYYAKSFPPRRVSL